MYNYLGVLSSDSLNRDGYIIAFEALEKTIADNAIKGMPSNVDHDFHRPLGWILPFGIVIEPQISRTIGNFFVCESTQDSEIIYPKIQNHWQIQNYKACNSYIDEFKQLLNDNFSSEGKFISKGCVTYILAGIAEKIFPSLFKNIDKSELVFLDDILAEFEYIGSGIFKNKINKFCIFCHQYFLRNLSLHNNYNTYFIDEFIRLKYNKNITLRIAIDRNLIGLSSTYTGVLEFDYWWGPKFSDDIASLPNNVTRYECNEAQRFFNGISGTEFWWKTDKNERILEIEEIREKPSLGIDENSYGCRYIHSIYDNDKKEFNHFDGAVRMYSEEQILKRWDLNINKAGKDTDYTKLFRIDGKLELSDWKKLCILYYKGNPLLFEYFGAKEEYDGLKSINEPQEKVYSYTPNKISSIDGIRLFISYHNKHEDYKSFERKIINPDVIEFQNGEVLNVFECDIIEIEKYLKRFGGKIEYPDGVDFVKLFDFYSNYPIILHGAENKEENLRLTLEAFRFIFEKKNQSKDRTICFTLGYELEDFEVRLSVFGKSSEIVKWIEINPNIPVNYEEFRVWLIKQKKWIYDNYNYTKKDFSHILKSDGVFYIKRKPIDNEMIVFNDETGSIKINSNEEIDALIKEGAIFPSYFVLIKNAICTKTGEDYFKTDTSKYLDDDVQMLIEKADVLGFFWTDEKYN